MTPASTDKDKQGLLAKARAQARKTAEDVEAREGAPDNVAHENVTESGGEIQTTFTAHDDPITGERATGIVPRENVPGLKELPMSEDDIRRAEDARANEQAENAYEDLQRNKALVAARKASLPSLATERDELDAFGDLLADEMVLPVMKLVQGVSRDADPKEAGRFYNTLTGEYKNELVVAILALSRSRSLFGKSFDDPPLCASDDAVRPRQIVEVSPPGMTGVVSTGPTCGECPMSQWGTARDGEGKGQACRFTFNLLCMDLDDGQPYILRVSGTSLDGARKYLSAGKLARTPAYATSTRIGSRAEKFEQGAAYVLTFAPDGPLPGDLAQQMRTAAANYRSVNLGADGDGPIEAPFEE